MVRPEGFVGRDDPSGDMVEVCLDQFVGLGGKVPSEGCAKGGRLQLELMEPLERGIPLLCVRGGKGR